MTPTPSRSMHLNKRVFMVFSISAIMPDTSDLSVAPIGTAFGVHRPGIAITAAHVVTGRQQVRLVSTYSDPLRHLHVLDIVLHEVADVAIVRFEPSDNLEWSALGRPDADYTDFPLGEDVIAYGFPQVGAEKPIPGRLMGGHIQCVLTRETGPYRYAAYELSFPAFHNLSGAPVYRDRVRQQVIGVITDSTSYGSTEGEEHIYAAWSLAAALVPLRPWIEEVAGAEKPWAP